MGASAPTPPSPHAGDVFSIAISNVFVGISEGRSAAGVSVVAHAQRTKRNERMSES